MHGRFRLLCRGYSTEIIVHRVIGFVDGGRGRRRIILVWWRFLAISYQDDTIFIIFPQLLQLTSHDMLGGHERRVTGRFFVRLLHIRVVAAILLTGLSGELFVTTNAHSHAIPLRVRSTGHHCHLIVFDEISRPGNICNITILSFAYDTLKLQI